ncbi:hypothetical protein D9M68_752780 [compost metagenome]
MSRLTAMFATASLAPFCNWLIIPSISPLECWVRLARLRTSSATTAKPRPCSPARAASMAALRASRLVCPAMSWITFSTRPMALLSPARCFTTRTVSAIPPASCSVPRLWRLTSSRPLAVSWLTRSAPWEAVAALRATSCAVAVIRCMALATCSTIRRWLSIAALVSLAMASTCLACSATWPMARRTSPSRPWMFWMLSLSTWPSSFSSSRLPA